ncbi:MAG: hypothetical protein JXQ91_05430 [Vannielia sp.]|uniref:hypothetical protein n=1 Tax=Vannielia sp. TaxID=2813045 RepID=UPI003B8EA4AA
MTEQPDFRIGASLLRRIFAAAMFALLAYVLLKMGFSGDGPLWGRALLVGFGGAVVAMGVWLWQATEGGLVLKAETLETDSGKVLARLDQIARVERGAFAMKPAGGFVLKMKEKQKLGWAPGLWWVRGKTVAVGGVLHPSAGKAMGQMIEATMAEAALQKSPDAQGDDAR